MTYINGALAPVSTQSRDDYLHHIEQLWPFFRKHGALRMVDCWGVDLPKGKQTDFHGAVDAAESETVTFSWIEWPDRATADACWQAMPDDPDMQHLSKMPFDGSRMIAGGFEPILTSGTGAPSDYVQGFVAAVPADRREDYLAMAHEGWQMFQRLGAIGSAECWGQDVPHGKRTDFYRATHAKEGEVIVFSWVQWPDRATCDAAFQTMHEEAQGKPMPEMPFDGMRMFWGGFQTIFDSAACRS